MTRKDYILMANCINTHLTAFSKAIDNVDMDNSFREGALKGSVAMIEGLCDALHIDNPKFDKARFVDAALGEKK